MLTVMADSIANNSQNDGIKCDAGFQPLRDN